MKTTIAHPEIFGVTESSLAVAFELRRGEAGGRSETCDEPASVLLDGERRASVAGPGTRLVRIEGLDPDREYEVAIEAKGAEVSAPDAYFPGSARTLPPPEATCVGSFATLNDLHFGELRMGGQLTPDGEYGEATPEFPAVSSDEYEIPYPEFMNGDAIAEINALGVDLSVVKGDIADRGLPEQFETAARVFEGFEAPHHAFLGNHDYLAHADPEHGPVDGYALLGQPRAPRVVELGGWRLLLLETSEPGVHHGAFGEERLGWLEEELSASHEARVPTLLFMHHHPVPPEHRHSYPNTIGIRPEDSLRLFDTIGACPEVRGVLIGHTHRNRIRRYAASGSVPYIEVQNPKDYPGGFGHYRLFADGHFRQEVRRTGSRRALEHATRCRDLFRGGYRRFTFGQLWERSFASEAMG